MTKTERFWRAIGGRKQANGLLYSALITFMAYRLNATFESYALYLGLALLGTSTIVAMEDRKASGSFPNRRASDSKPAQVAP